MDRSAHLLLVPDDSRADAALVASDARVVASYGEFSLVEAAGADEQDLRSAGADRRDDMREVSLPGGSVDPLRERDSLAAKGEAKPSEVQAVVQFVGPVKDGWLERLGSTGVRIVQYVAQNGYLVHGEGGEVDRLAGLVGTDPAVRAVTPVRAEDKLSPRLQEGRGEGERPVSVQTVGGSAGEAARSSAARAGRSLRATSEVGELWTQFLSLTSAEIDALAADPAVLSVLRYSEPELLDERASQIVAGNVGAGGGPLNGPGYLAWHDAPARGFGPGTPNGTFDGFVIDVTDEGLDDGSATPAHPDFHADGTLSLASRVAYTHDFSGEGSARDCGGHGTNVASVAAGYGAGAQDAQGYRNGMGIAPRARLGASKMFTCAGAFSLNTTFTDLTSQAYANEARISNNSWGNQDDGAYTADSFEYDSLVRDAQPSVPGNQQMVEVFAAGNDGDGQSGPANEGYGSVSSPGTAKNVITVGASEGMRPIGGADGCGVGDAAADQADDILGFSSRGPTNDLRTKPDLVSPGSHVVGAAPQVGGAYNGRGACLTFFPAGNAFHNLISGTSQAAPGVSGAAALVRDWYDRTQGPPPSPAMTKAILVNAATDLAGGDNGLGDTVGSAPNSDQGWGRVNVGGVLDPTLPREYQDQSELLSDTGQELGRVFRVQASNRPVKVTLAFTDAPGNPGSNDSTVNDLDLVVRQGGRTYKGNILAGGRSIAGGDADPRNNLESVILPAGASGRMAVEVLASKIAGDGVPGVGDSTDQDFALVVSNADDLGLQPVLDAATPNITDGDTDGAIEPGETFRMNVPLRNSGNANSTGFTGSASGAGIDFSASGSSWPAIPQGQTRTNSPQFVGTVSTAVGCGTNLTARVALAGSASGDTAEIPLPVGGPGPTATRSRVQSLAIPDDSPAGVVSTIDVPTRGIVRDLDVGLTLTHSWVGDLRIELTSPAGTTVRLIEHPGGPDNGQDNFTNTVFDDTGTSSIGEDTLAPFTDTFRPQQDRLSRFNGEQQRGTWRLRIRDLYEGDTGSLVSWDTRTETAVCNFDTTPPDTGIASSPPNPDASNDASFAFSSNDPGAVFDCRLDGGAYQACDSSAQFVDLPAGAHTLEVRAVDGTGNMDATPASHAWTIVTPTVVMPAPPPDRSPPSVSVSRPEAPFTTARPRLAGSAGVAAGDAASVTVKLWQGSSASGTPDQTFMASRNPSSGAWSHAPDRDLADGVWTARAEQSDAAGNTGVSTAVSFRVDTTPPDFALLPVESDLADARAGKLTLLAGCGSACRVSAELKAGKGRARAPVLGRLDTRLGEQGSRSFKVKVTRAGRSALRGRGSVKASMRMKIVAGKRTLDLKRALVLRPVGLRRVVRSGLPLAGACQEECTLTASLTMGASEARRHGIPAPGGKPVTVAGGTSRASAAASRLVVKLRSSARKRLLRARAAKVTMESLVKGAFGPYHRTSQRLTLRR